MKQGAASFHFEPNPNPRGNFASTYPSCRSDRGAFTCNFKDEIREVSAGSNGPVTRPDETGQL
jgi:hypothetical protein